MIRFNSHMWGRKNCNQTQIKTMQIIFEYLIIILTMKDHIIVNLKSL